MKEILKVSSHFIEHALRNLGYTNYSAIADIIDNSIEPEVGASQVKIYVNYQNKQIDESSSIYIVDNGCGMDAEGLKNALTLGSYGKDLECNLGFYGAGLKTASMSIGRCLTILTKQQDTSLCKAIFDLDNKDENGMPIIIYEVGNSDDNAFFNDITKSSQGTCILISKLDRVSNHDPRTFIGTLSRKTREIFNKYIEDEGVSFYLNDNKLEKFDTIGAKTGLGTKLLTEGHFEHNGTIIEYKGWNIPLGASIKDYEDGYGRNNHSQGIYIYRQKRLVGKALDFGLCKKASLWTNGFRFELFINGKTDTIFSTTFTKTILEKDISTIDKSFYDKLSPIVKELAKQCEREQKFASKQSEDEKDKELQELSKRALAKLNGNTMLISALKQRGKNNKPNLPKAKNPNPKPQENPNPIKQRKGKAFDDIEYVDWLPNDPMYDTYQEENKHIIRINRNHAFYKKILYPMIDNQDYYLDLLQYICCDYHAKYNADYYNNEDAQKIIDSYVSQLSEGVRRAFDF